MTRSKPISLQMRGSGSMRGRQTISCTSRPDRCVYPLHLFTQASAASPQLENRVVSLCEGKRGSTATKGRWRWVRDRGGRPRNALLVEGLEGRDFVVLVLFCWIMDNAGGRCGDRPRPGVESEVVVRDRAAKSLSPHVPESQGSGEGQVRTAPLCTPPGDWRGAVCQGTRGKRGGKTDDRRFESGTRRREQDEAVREEKEARIEGTASKSSIREHDLGAVPRPGQRAWEPGGIRSLPRAARHDRRGTPGPFLLDSWDPRRNHNGDRLEQQMSVWAGLVLLQLTTGRAASRGRGGHAFDGCLGAGQDVDADREDHGCELKIRSAAIILRYRHLASAARGHLSLARLCSGLPREVGPPHTHGPTALHPEILGRHILSSSMGLPAWIIHPPGCRSCQIHGRRVQPTQLMLADTRNMTSKTRLAQCKGLYVPSAPGRTDRARAPCARGRKRQLVRCGSKPISQPVDAVRGTGGHPASSPEHRFYLIQGSTQGLAFSPCHDWRRRNNGNVPVSTLPRVAGRADLISDILTPVENPRVGEWFQRASCAEDESSLPSPTSDGRTRGAEPVMAKNIQHLVHTPPVASPSLWSDRCSNARTDSCMSRGHTRRWVMYFPSSGPSQKPNPQTALAEPELAPHAPIRIRVEKAVLARSSSAANIGKKLSSRPQRKRCNSAIRGVPGVYSYYGAGGLATIPPIAATRPSWIGLARKTKRLDVVSLHLAFSAGILNSDLLEAWQRAAYQSGSHVRPRSSEGTALPPSQYGSLRTVHVGGQISLVRNPSLDGPQGRAEHFAITLRDQIGDRIGRVHVGNAFTTLGRVKPEDGTVIETAVCLLPGIYHVDAAIATIVYSERYGRATTDQDLAQRFFCTKPACEEHAKPPVLYYSTSPAEPIPAALILVSCTSTDLTHRRPLNPDCRIQDTVSHWSGPRTTTCLLHGLYQVETERLRKGAGPAQESPMRFQPPDRPSPRPLGTARLTEEAF
ncbi:hypothetical protein OIDMADRAFT_24143 [Oidiodendron maius Zn]|uniref:Uncharacterized protein n=1 Tax=Oidiodendron maius (strain Zn) TaxID=913774 RepID=A0A0C3DUK9_OIDMZ|nr:hypothetical protein OIDMADRAFT_24143 [Oidiodendron maius Zn]